MYVSLFFFFNFFVFISFTCSVLPLVVANKRSHLFILASVIRNTANAS